MCGRIGKRPCAWHWNGHDPIIHYVYLTIAFVGVVTLVFVSLVALATVIG